MTYGIYAKGKGFRASTWATRFLIGFFVLLPFMPALASTPHNATEDSIAAPVVAACRADNSAVCARFFDGAGGEHEIELLRGSLKTVDVGLMGTHSMGGIAHQLAYVYGSADRSDLKGNALIAVLDLTAATKIASVASPAGYSISNTYFAYIRGPRGEKYPFMAPDATTSLTPSGVVNEVS
jgi:hypothetical protein